MEHTVRVIIYNYMDAVWVYFSLILFFGLTCATILLICTTIQAPECKQAFSLQSFSVRKLLLVQIVALIADVLFQIVYAYLFAYNDTVVTRFLSRWMTPFVLSIMMFALLISSSRNWAASSQQIVRAGLLGRIKMVRVFLPVFAFYLVAILLAVTICCVVYQVITDSYPAVLLFYNSNAWQKTRTEIAAIYSIRAAYICFSYLLIQYLLLKSLPRAARLSACILGA